MAVRALLSAYSSDARILERVLDPLNGYAATYDVITLAKLKRYCEKQKEDLAVKDRLAPKNTAIMLDDEQMIAALLDRMNHNIDLPKVETANGWRLLREAQKRFLAQSGKFNAYQFLSWVKQRNMGYLPFDTPQPAYDTQQATKGTIGAAAAKVVESVGRRWDLEGFDDEAE